MFKLYLTHQFDKGKWKISNNENIVRIWPRPSPIRNGDQWEEFYRAKVILHVQHRSFEQLINDGNISWSTLYSQHILGEAVENEDDFNSDESLDEIESSENEEEEFRFDWMRLAEIGPNSRIISSSDLGSRDTDRNHDWVNYAKQFYSSNDITRAPDFVHEVSETLLKEMII